MKSLDSFLKELRNYPDSDTVKNPYRDRVLANNLKIYLNTMLELSGPRVLLVGEAPGYKGCKLTGIPFSSGTIFERIGHPLLQKIGSEIRLAKIESENTATIVWNYLSTQTVTPLFWNSFPFHPHPAGNEMKNRAPTSKEIETGINFLRQVYNLYNPDLIGGVGRKGTDAARKAFSDHDIVPLRHPSHGGKNEFIAGMDRLFKKI